MPVCDPYRPTRVAAYFTRDHLTMREIAKLEGITHPAVWKILHRLGIPASAGTWVVTRCAACGVSFRRQRARCKATRRPTCSPECYFQLRKTTDYRPWRQGQRIARQLVTKAGWFLAPGQVVHHIDGDNRNNALDNLAVFASHSDHLKHHHTGQPQPIWTGRDVKL